MQLSIRTLTKYHCVGNKLSVPVCITLVGETILSQYNYGTAEIYQSLYSKSQTLAKRNRNKESSYR